MASMVEILNQGLGGLNTPLGQLGTQLMLASGPQQGNPGGGVRMGQALAGMSEMQRQQALQQYRQQQMSLLEQQQQAHVQAAQQKADQQKQWQQRLQDPNFLASLGPTARQFAQLGVDPGELLRASSADALAQHRDASLAQAQAHFEQSQANRSTGGAAPAPKQPAMRQVLEEPLDGGMIQKHIYDPATASYKPYGKPYRQYAPPKASPLDALMNDIMPDDNSGTGQAVPGLPGSNTTMAPAPQGADLLMRGSGSNPTPSIISGGSNPLAAREGMRVPGQPKPATPMTKADYDALPSGTKYIDPVSGRVATKK